MAPSTTLAKEDLQNYKDYISQGVSEGIIPEIVSSLQLRTIYQLFISRGNHTYVGSVLCLAAEGKPVTICLIVDAEWGTPTILEINSNTSFIPVVYRELAKKQDVITFDSFTLLAGQWQQGSKNMVAILNHLVSTEQARAM